MGSSITSWDDLLSDGRAMRLQDVDNGETTGDDIAMQALKH